jgi:hypothetical protein
MSIFLSLGLFVVVYLFLHLTGGGPVKQDGDEGVQVAEVTDNLSQHMVRGVLLLFLIACGVCNCCSVGHCGGYL